MLRDYQQRSIDQLYTWFEAKDAGHPCLVLPTGSGKSHIVAALCKDAVQNWPETRILMLTHVKELIEQNAERMLQHWPGAPLGIFSASIGKRQLDQITFAGIQSVRSRASEIGHVDLIIIDECHLVSHKQQGSYRMLIDELIEINPALRVIGLTATPFRLGHGLITDEPALFSELIEPVRIEELIHKGFLAPLRSKHTEVQFDLRGVHKRGGEFIEGELQEVMNDADQNRRVVEEIRRRGEGRKRWLLFCTGVDHAVEIALELKAQGVSACCVTGATPKAQREKILSDFKAGEIQALTNANVLTTGFDHPEIDLIAFLRPTLSPGLYVQMAGRGMRVKTQAEDCLVLDFAGNVERHGPITAVESPKRAGEGGKPGPGGKTCPQCQEIIHPSVKVCPCCGFQFPVKRLELSLSNRDIMGLEPQEMQVSTWRWRRHISRSSGKAMLAVSYYGAISDPIVTEYFAVTHEGYAGDKARRELLRLLLKARAEVSGALARFDLHEALPYLEQAQAPEKITFRRDGKFYRVTERHFTSSTSH